MPRRSYGKRKRYAKKKSYRKKKRGTARVRSGRLSKGGMFTRTLQIATQRQKNIRIKFVSNQQYQVCCQSTGTNTYSETTFLAMRCNMYRNGSQNIGGSSPSRSWGPVGSGYGPGTASLDAEGVDLWKGKYNHFTVLGAKLTATFNTTNVQDMGTDTTDTQRQGAASSTRPPPRTQLESPPPQGTYLRSHIWSNRSSCLRTPTRDAPCPWGTLLGHLRASRDQSSDTISCEEDYSTAD